MVAAIPWGVEGARGAAGPEQMRSRYPPNLFNHRSDYGMSTIGDEVMKKGLLKRLKTDVQPIPESEKFIDLGDLDLEGLELDVVGEDVRPGMVVVIDPVQPGRLRVASTAYDRKVAGIIAGAGGVKTGMMMKQRDSIADGRHPVALTGRVYCLADASGAAIEPGDLLVTSATPGHAMKVTDWARSQGAILGKAMTGLERGKKGLVLVLVSLQ